MAEDQTSSVNRFFSSSRNLAASTLISRVLGLFRETLTAAVIGGGALMSGWTLALTWANTFRRILGEGELGKALVPVLSLSLETEGKERARDRFSTILLWLTLLLCALAVVLGVPSWLIARTMEPGRWKTAFELFPILAPYMVFICVVGAATACANVLREFFLPSLTAILQNVVLILALALVCRHYRGMSQLRVFGLAVLIAGVLEMALIFLILWRRGMMVRISSAIMRDRETLLSIWKLILPGLLGASALQLSLQCDRLIAGFIGDFAAASLYFSERLVYLPVGIFAVSFATVANTELSRFAAAGHYDDLTAMLMKTIRILLFVSVPFTAFMVCFPEEIIRVFYNYGRFDDTAVRETAYAFLMYSAGIPLFAVFKISSVAFTSRRDMVTPLKVSLACIAINIVLNLLAGILSFAFNVNDALLVVGKEVIKVLLVLVACVLELLLYANSPVFKLLLEFLYGGVSTFLASLYPVLKVGDLTFYAASIFLELLFQLSVKEANGLCICRNLFLNLLVVLLTLLPKDFVCLACGVLKSVTVLFNKVVEVLVNGVNLVLDCVLASLQAFLKLGFGLGCLRLNLHDAVLKVVCILYLKVVSTGLIFSGKA